MRYAILVLVISAVPLRATDPVYPVTYSTPSPDGQYLFVMLAPANPDPKQNPDGTPHAREVRQKYSASGMYRTDGSVAPLWTVDWYAYEVYPANDGIHVVRLDTSSRIGAAYISGVRLPAETREAQLEGPALSFLASGNVLKAYTVRELVAKPDELPQSMTHVLWMTDGIITKDGKRFVMSTHDSQQLIFELATGEIVVRKEAGLGNIQVWTVRFLMGVILLFILAWIVRAMRGQRMARG